MSRSFRQITCLIVAACSLSAARPAAAGVLTLISDDFSDGSRAKTGATDANFFIERGSATVTDDSGAGKLDSGNALYGNVDTLFVAPFTPVTLTRDGYSLSLKFDYRHRILPDSNSNAAPPFGIYNSQGTVVTGDGVIGVGSNAANANNDRGYYGHIRTAPGVFSGGTGVGEETGTAAPVLGGVGDRTDIPSTSTFFINIGSDTGKHTFELLLTRLSATSIRIRLFVDNNPVAEQTTDDATPVVTPFMFDGIAFRASNYAIDNVTVIANLPEPASLALLAAGALLLSRRRRS